MKINQSKSNDHLNAIFKLVLIITVLMLICSNSLGASKWQSVTWSDSDDKAYIKLDEEVKLLCNSIGKSNKDLFNKRVNDALNEWKKNRLNPYLLYKAVSLSRNKMKLHNTITEDYIESLQAFAKCFEEIQSPKSYRFCRLAFIVSSSVDPQKPYGKYYDKLLKINPTDYDVLHCAALVVINARVPHSESDRLKGFKTSLEYLRRIEDRKHANASDYQLMGAILQCIYELTGERKDGVEALTYYKRAVKMYPVDYAARGMLLNSEIPRLEKILGVNK